MLLPLAVLASLTFSGNFTQGGMVETFAPEGSAIYVNDEKIDCFGQHCLIGFDRDFDEVAYINAEFPDGTTAEYTFPIKQVNYKKSKINHVDQKMVTPNEQDQERIEEEALELGTKRVESVVASSQTCPDRFNFKKPRNSKISSIFGTERIYNGTPRKPHTGTDFVGKVGDSFTSPEDGTVVFVGDLFLDGLTMLVDHGCGVTSNFMHLSKATKQVGDKVKKGEELGKIGKSGLVTGPHLHWGVNLGTTRLDPLLLVKKP